MSINAAASHATITSTVQFLIDLIEASPDLTEADKAFIIAAKFDGRAPSAPATEDEIEYVMDVV